MQRESAMGTAEAKNAGEAYANMEKTLNAD